MPIHHDGQHEWSFKGETSKGVYEEILIRWSDQIS